MLIFPIITAEQGKMNEKNHFSERQNMNPNPVENIKKYQLSLAPPALKTRPIKYYAFHNFR